MANQHTSNVSESGELLPRLSSAFADIVDRVQGASIQVHGRRSRPATGTIYSPGLVLTADHALGPDDRVRVRMPDGRALDAQLAGRDPSADLALLRVDGLAADPIPLAEGNVKPGHLAVSIARTWSNRPAAAAGMVSAVGGPLATGHGRSLDRLFRLDLIPHPNYSGGPIVDAGGRLLGIGTGALLRDSAAAIPADIAWRVAESLAAHGRIRRGYMGINTQAIRIPAAQRGDRTLETGLLVMGLAHGGPAESAGLLVGDILLDVNGRPVEDTDELMGLLTADLIDERVPVVVVRGLERQTVHVTIGDRGR
jgi:S1-C subfamily serine protease